MTRGRRRRSAQSTDLQVRETLCGGCYSEGIECDSRGGVQKMTRMAMVIESLLKHDIKAL